MFTVENTFTSYPDMMSVTQVREALQIGRNKVYELLTSHAIASVKIGGDYRIPKRYLIDYLNSACAE